MNDLNQTLPQPTTVTVTLTNGQTDTIEAREFTFGQLPKVMKYSESIYGNVAHLASADKLDTATMVTELLSSGGDDFMRLIGLSIQRDRDWFDLLPIDAAIDVVAAVVEVNMRFFVQRVLPKFEGRMKALAGATSRSPS